MVVVVESGGLVSIVLTREGDGNKPAVLHQRLEGSIHGGDAKLTDVAPGNFEHLHGAEGTGRLVKGGPDCGALCRGD